MKKYQLVGIASRSSATSCWEINAVCGDPVECENMTTWGAISS